MSRYALKINGAERHVDAQPDTPILWILREHLGLTGTKYGCGVAQCRACTILVDGEAAFGCQLPVSEAVGKSIVTIEGLSEKGAHPLQKAWIAEQVPQCGYCQSGMIMNAVALLSNNRNPSRAEIAAHMTNICRCGTYTRVVRAIERAAKEMQP